MLSYVLKIQLHSVSQGNLNKFVSGNSKLNTNYITYSSSFLKSIVHSTIFILNYAVVLILYVFPATCFFTFIKTMHVPWRHSGWIVKTLRVVIVVKKSKRLKKKLGTYFKIQANYTKTHILNNKAAKEIIFP